jgi:RND family efflux transporter MFP subunit
MSRNTLKIVLPVVVLIVGVAAAMLLASSRKAPPRTERVSLGPLVEVIVAEVGDVPIVITGHGEVGAKVAVDVVPQVSGQVDRVHPALVAGGFFKAGEPLIVIDPEDYELAVERAVAAVARAQVALEREQAEAAVAREEWDALNPGEEPPSGLVVREPQVRQAEAELAAAQADLHAAQLSLARTKVSVPFEGTVVSESVDVGQYVTPGAPVATVYGTDAVEVRLPLEDRELAYFDVPDRSGGGGPRAEVRAEFGGSIHSWEGRVTRMETQVDPSSRMVHIVVEILNPFDRANGRPPLLPGTFVDVRIFGKTAENVVAIPRYAVREGGVVWLVEDGTLRIRPVGITRSDREQALVSGGLTGGDQIVVSSLDVVTDGMKVRSAEGEVGGGEA